MFKQHQLNDFTLGELLRLRREEQKLSLAQAAEAARIGPQRARALEEGAYNTLPAGVYAKNILRAYATALGLSYRIMLTHYERERGAYDAHADTTRVFGRERVKRSYFLLLPKWWRGGILVVALLFGFGYLGLRVRRIIVPPALVISEPAAYAVSTEPFTMVQGTVDERARVFINDREVITGVGGTFSERVDLESGVNDIVIRAQKKYGRDAETVRHVLVE